MSGSLTPWDGTEQLSEVTGPCGAVGATRGGRRALSSASPHTLQPCSRLRFLQPCHRCSALLTDYRRWVWDGPWGPRAGGRGPSAALMLLDARLLRPVCVPGGVQVALPPAELCTRTALQKLPPQVTVLSACAHERSGDGDHGQQLSHFFRMWGPRAGRGRLRPAVGAGSAECHGPVATVDSGERLSDRVTPGQKLCSTCPGDADSSLWPRGRSPSPPAGMMRFTRDAVHLSRRKRKGSWNRGPGTHS